LRADRSVREIAAFIGAMQEARTICQWKGPIP
jgi:hypothetical protein